jgi:hypothetical protein
MQRLPRRRCGLRTEPEEERGGSVLREVLADLMMDLALAMLNTDPPSNEAIELRAHQTLERMNQP